MNLIVGNMIMLAGSIIMVCVGLLKTRRQILIWQTIQIALMGLASIFLGTIPGLIANIVGVVRNLLSYHSKLNRTAKILISLAAIVSTLLFNNIGWLGVLPIAAAVSYTLLMNTPDVRKLKWLIFATLLLWIVHDFAIQSYVSGVFNVFSAITCLIGIFRKEKVNGNRINQKN
ncbi:MAG: YgjV family protein [Bacteroidaceae bacterium]|nr:YgjV family protein [Bacteroidaceae bacterium]